MDSTTIDPKERESSVASGSSSFWQVGSAAPSRHGSGKKSRPKLLRRRWFQIFVSGLVLLFLVERTLVATGDPRSRSVARVSPSALEPIAAALLTPPGTKAVRSTVRGA